MNDTEPLKQRLLQEYRNLPNANIPDALVPVLAKQLIDQQDATIARLRGLLEDAEKHIYQTIGHLPAPGYGWLERAADNLAHRIRAELRAK